MKILHVTNWYPNPTNRKEAIWIKKQIESLPVSCKSDVIHLEVKFRKAFPWYMISSLDNIQQIIIFLPFRIWRMAEILHFTLLFYQLRIKKIYKKYDLINFHIAYPMLTYWHLLKKYVDRPIVITEHWSAYHFNFGLKKKLPRIQRIFRQGIPVITVSEALAADIERFAQVDFPTYIVPNVVDEMLFFPNEEIKKENFFFMIGQWKFPKDPFTAMEAFLEFNLEKKYLLKIGGYGPLWSDMQKWVSDRDPNRMIHMLGPLESYQVADHMRRCKAFLHPSDYETFSVVCAEAVSCGAFVIAPKIGGIPEVVDTNGVLLERWEKIDWLNALNIISANNNSIITGSNRARFSRREVSQVYQTVLKRIVGEANK